MSSGFTLAITSVYGSNGLAHKIDFLTELRYVRDQIPLPWILLGDFNLIRAPHESTSTNINLGNMLEFNHLIQELQITEIALLGRNFTYSNGRPTPTFSKFDRTFWSHEWEGSNLIANLQDLPNTDSDHVPLCLTISKQHK
jgi:exonuclease III